MKINRAYIKYPQVLEYVAFDEIVFQQDSDADESFAILNTQGVEGLFRHLKQWDYGEMHTIWDMAKEERFPFGTQDTLYFDKDNYILTVNYKVGYVGLCRGITLKDYANLF